jgi:thiol:disulfide interchange protein
MRQAVSIHACNPSDPMKPCVCSGSCGRGWVLQSTGGSLLAGARLLMVAVVVAAVVVGSGCEIRDETVQSGTKSVSERRLLPSSVRNERQAVNNTATTAIEYVENYRTGLERAAASGRPLVVVCRASWCRWCAGLSQGVLSDPKVVQRSARCICVTLDADRDTEVCRRLGVRGFPTVILQTPDGREVKRLTGRTEVESLAAAIDEATSRLAAGPHSDANTPVVR